MSDELIRVVVATHKAYRMPEDPVYLPLHVGAEGKTDEDGNPLNLGFRKDNTGKNISSRNPSYCELTGMYWAWKNLKADYLGLVHYRRYFRTTAPTMLLPAGDSDPFDHILTGQEMERIFRKCNVIVPAKRRYYIETLYSHYSHTHYAEHLDETRHIIEEMYPSYLRSFDRVVNRTWGYMFNMMIMRRDLYNAYCSWLFSILFTLEKRIDPAQLDSFQGRLYGRISEILFNVWLDRKMHTGRIRKRRIKEIPVIYMEPVDWIQKGKSFLEAKFLHRKYEQSF